MSVAPLTVMLPASEPEVVFKPEGDPAGIDALAAIVLEAAGRYDEFSDESRQFHRSGGWVGESRDDYVVKASHVARRADRMGDTLKRTGRAMLACADRLRNHLRTHEELADRKRVLDARLERLTGEIAAGTSVTLEQVIGWQERADDLAKAFKTLVAEDRDLQRITASNEDLLGQTLDSATSREDVTAIDGGRPEIAQRAMHKSGSPLGGNSTPEQVREWWKQLAPAERRAVVASYSHTIADADGVPPEVRERADRIRQEEALVRLQAKDADGTISVDEAQRLARIEREQQQAQPPAPVTLPSEGTPTY